MNRYKNVSNEQAKKQLAKDKKDAAFI